MIKLNAFVSVKPYFRDFSVFRVPLAGDSRSLFQLVKYLFDRDIAYAYPYGGDLYFKGDLHKTLSTIREFINKNPGVVLGFMAETELKPQKLTPNDAVILKPIVYSAFEKLLESRGFRVLQRTKKAIPQINKENSEKGLVIPLPGSENIAVLRGLRYMFEVRPSGYGILWLDVYSPPIDLQSMRRLSPRDIKRLNLMDKYHGMAVLKPDNRLNELFKIINILVDKTAGIKVLTLKFPDGDLIQFSMDLLELEAVEEGE